LEEKVGEAVLDAADEDDEVPELEEDDEEDEDEEDVEDKEEPASYPPALLAAAADPTNSTLLRAAELEAETSGTPHTVFETQLKEAKKVVNANSNTKAKANGKGKGDEDLRKIMMTNKKQRLYEKMKYSNAQQSEEVSPNIFKASVPSAMADNRCRRRNWSVDVKRSRRGRSERARHRSTFLLLV
jgi:pescadillo protein